MTFDYLIFSIKPPVLFAQFYISTPSLTVTPKKKTILSTITHTGNVLLFLPPTSTPPSELKTNYFTFRVTFVQSKTSSYSILFRTDITTSPSHPKRDVCIQGYNAFFPSRLHTFRINSADVCLGASVFCFSFSCRQSINNRFCSRESDRSLSRRFRKKNAAEQNKKRFKWFLIFIKVGCLCKKNLFVYITQKNRNTYKPKIPLNMYLFQWHDKYESIHSIRTRN